MGFNVRINMLKNHPIAFLSETNNECRSRTQKHVLFGPCIEWNHGVWKNIGIGIGWEWGLP